MRAHEADAAVKFEKAMGVELAPAPKGANYDFEIVSGPNKGKRVDFMYTADSQDAIDMMNLYFIKGRAPKWLQKQGRDVKIDKKTGKPYSDDLEMVKESVEQMKKNINDHVNDNKADIVPMDLRNLTPDNRQAVKDYASSLPTDKQAKIVFMED